MYFKLYKENFPNQSLHINQFVDILKNSYSHLAQIANLHLYSFSSIKTKLLRDFGTKSFELVPCKESWRLQLKKDAMAQIPKPTIEEVFTLDMNSTIGCPALVSFTAEDSVMKQTWEWYLQLIEMVCENETKNNPNFSVFDLLKRS